MGYLCGSISLRLSSGRVIEYKGENATRTLTLTFFLALTQAQTLALTLTLALALDLALTHTTTLTRRQCGQVRRNLHARRSGLARRVPRAHL